MSWLLQRSVPEPVVPVGAEVGEVGGIGQKQAHEGSRLRNAIHEQVCD